MDVGQGPNWGCSAKGKKNHISTEVRKPCANREPMYALENFQTGLFAQRFSLCKLGKNFTENIVSNILLLLHACLSSRYLATNDFSNHHVTILTSQQCLDPPSGLVTSGYPSRTLYTFVLQHSALQNTRLGQPADVRHSLNIYLHNETARA
jgi:hypothetical protein